MSFYPGAKKYLVKNPGQRKFFKSKQRRMSMTSGKFRMFALLILILIFRTDILIAGTTGKIAGTIIDKDTGEPLFGVNVVLTGTTLGAASDIDGYFVILNVPPGMHTINASMIGYAKVTVDQVRVRIDETSPVNIEMISESFQTDNVIVVAQRNELKKDVSTSVAAVRSEEIETLPVSSIDDVVGLQAGVEEGLVIRGGESNELLLQLDGVTMRDPRNNQPISQVALSAIQEVSIERGGFNAEYGQVRSGIVNIVLKEGDAARYFGSIQTKYSPATQKHLGVSVFDPMSMWNRPYLDPAVCWTGTENGVWDLYTQRQFPRFEGWNSISERLLSDEDPTNDLSPAAAKRLFEWERRRRPSIEPDYIIDGSFGGPVPLIGKMLGNLRFFASFRTEREMLLIPLSRPDYKDYNWSLKLNSDLSDYMKLQISASTGKTYNVAINENDAQFNNSSWGINAVQFWNPTDYMRSPFKIAEITNEQRASRIFTDSWYSHAEVAHTTLSAKLTNFISSATFYEISFEHVHRNYLTGPIRQRDLSEKYEIVPGYFVDEAPFGFDINPATGLTGMFYGGHSSTIRDSSKLNSYLLKGDLTSQIHKEHLIKLGFEFSFYDLDLDYGAVNIFFDDINYVKQTRQPFRFSLYAQDKIEMLGFIANLGLRLDISNPNTQWPDVEYFNPDYFSSDYNPSMIFPMKDAKIDYSLSPRLGISHPITENSKLYFNYGHFKQVPAYEEIFRIGRSSSGELRNYGNPNLVQAKTISYELGYDHVMFEDYLLQIAAFYNDISNQQGFTQYVSDRLGIGYFLANNNNYEDIRGLEITFKKTRGNWYRGFINFTYQVNTQGAFGKPTINDNPAEQKRIDQNTSLVYQQKPVPQPRANLSLSFFTPADYGFDFLGIKPLGEWTLDLLGSWRSGEYITYNPIGVRDVVNNAHTTDNLNFDFRLNKTFNFGQLNVMFFMEVRNVFNHKRLSGASFYDVHDQRYYMESLHLPESDGYNNIVGEDRIGDYRLNGAAYQPIEQVGNINDIINPLSSVIYYDRTNKLYMNYVEGSWSEVESGRMQKVLDDKAYIDMPNNSSFDFLNPRQIYFGINLSFNL